MSRRLATLRAIAIVAATLKTLVLLGLLRIQSRGRVGRDGERADTLGRRWAQSVRRLTGMQVIVDGEVPVGPVAIVANHLSYMDVIALWCVVPGVFVARADVANWPIVGIASQLIGTIFIDRSRKRDLVRVIPALSLALARGRNVIFFPEATSSPGAEVLSFRSALFEAAARRDVPVVGVSLQYATREPAPTAAWSICWWGGMTFGGHVFALLAIPRFEVRIRFSSPISPSKDRKELCRLARESVVKTFNPTALESFEMHRSVGRTAMENR